MHDFNNKGICTKCGCSRAASEAFNFSCEPSLDKKGSEPFEAPLRCPRCKSQQITANKRGFKLGRALGIGLLTGGIPGIVAGSIGKNKIVLTCLKCGKQWKPGA